MDGIVKCWFRKPGWHRPAAPFLGSQCMVSTMNMWLTAGRLYSSPQICVTCERRMGAELDSQSPKDIILSRPQDCDCWKLAPNITQHGEAEPYRTCRRERCVVQFSLPMPWIQLPELILKFTRAGARGPRRTALRRRASRVWCGRCGCRRCCQCAA